MKKSYCLKIKKKRSQKKLRRKSGRQKSPVFLCKNNSAKICIPENLEYTKVRNKKENTKAEMQKGLQRSKSSVLIHGQYAFSEYSSFLCLAGPVAMIYVAAGFVVS